MEGSRMSVKRINGNHLAAKIRALLAKLAKIEAGIDAVLTKYPAADTVTNLGIWMYGEAVVAAVICCEALPRLIG